MADRRTSGGTGFRVGIGAGVLLLAVAGLLASQWFAREMQRSVVQAFNREQLLTARHASGLIERELELIGQEILAAGDAVAEAGFDPERDLARLRGSLQRLQRSGVLRAAVVDLAGGHARVYLPHRREVSEEPPADLAALLPPADRLAPGRVWVGEPRPEGPAPVLALATPLGPDGGRVLLFELNVSWLLAPFLSRVRSGETGYAWLIDGEGRFLYHPDPAFVGQSAFDVRGRQYPGVSYERINAIQREHMLRGQEGLGAYTSGRHGGLTGEIEKLIAYTPVTVGEGPGRTWALAVVAPLSDLGAALERGRRAQLVLELLVLGIVVLAGLSVVLSEVRWSDVLERRVAERTAELARSEQRYRSLVEGSEDAIFTLDEALRIESANSVTGRLLGVPAADLPGREFVPLLPREAGERQRQLVRRVFATGRSARGEFARPGLRGRVWIDAGYMPLPGEGGAVARVLCIARDVTERRDLERNLASTEKLAAMGTLAAGFAHEINNPLGVILGFTELLRDRFPGGSPEREDLEVVERQGLACKRIVDNLLSFSRAEPETMEHTDLAGAIRRVVQVVRHNLEIRGIALETDLAEGIPPVRGDARQLEQVFLNLITNAIAAMPQGGTLRLRARSDPERREAVATVTDTGTGIPPEDLGRIFEPFFTTKPPGEGTGLGLFVSYGIVGKYGGQLVCESRPADGDGPTGATGETTFTVRLRAQAPR